MKRIRFTEEQIIAVLRGHEPGAKTADLVRKHGISEATLYNWRPSTAAWTCRTPSVCGRWKTVSWPFAAIRGNSGHGPSYQTLCIQFLVRVAR